ncbi:hypothetical protein NC653_027069 [Populus alba x Populus x berolinensis]|uniref:Uncharacterized protein n=1 Tax=Populus alba x Populus x berolinensis TaxID=444605 RepID=A0AAD6M4D2_9ROSI|nr:hypothetical protein NC653_027069 [Populus alba x Populus x berolinensis]
MFVRVTILLKRFNLKIFRNDDQIDDAERLMEIIKQAAKEGAMEVYTLADPSMAESAKLACKLLGIPATDVIGPITEAIASHLDVLPSEDYFQRKEAIEFTIKQGDGVLPQNLNKDDIVLAGVPRTGKTPLSIYLPQNGHKVANVRLVKDVELPKSLFEVDPEKDTINAIV